ncbi:cytochrome P450 [Natronosporangium hydrolyticum]|uniref:Cytochrome P450 n=1 Tax=Natronosporangium hydrolyticum TaxID=2811111 RepID=A0A895YNZ0_9ACTN|nr:cytochrome P450 [Natronosporangium hydrolyticum]QSB17003.1 cytochrome P450 [Natronosporangium hydrolyticum]
MDIDFLALQQALDSTIQEAEPRYWFVDEAGPARMEPDRAWGILDAAAAAIIDARGLRGIVGPTAGYDVLHRTANRLYAELPPEEAFIRLKQAIWTLLVAGHETTALSVFWTLCLLQRDPLLQRRLRLVGGSTYPGPVAEATGPAITVRHLLDESLRLRPPVYGIGRVSTREVALGGVLFPPGVEFLVCPWVVHRNSLYFPHGDEFRPDRWSEIDREDLPEFSFLPFGGGPRGCIGERLARLEAETILQVLLAAATLEVAGPEPAPRAQLTVRPERPVSATLRPRSEERHCVRDGRPTHA